MFCQDERTHSPFSYGNDHHHHLHAAPAAAAGEPKDPAYERQYEQTSYHHGLPEVVKRFLLNFHKAISSALVVDQKPYEQSANKQRIAEVQDLYENNWNKLTDSYFKTSPWPEAEAVAALVGDDALFLVLYRELYYRHVYARVGGGPTLDQRVESYYNYCNLFNYVLNADGPAALELPEQWLWDVVDEFVYQFQSFCQYRGKTARKSEDETAFLRSSPKVWNVHTVLNVLHSLADRGGDVVDRQPEVKGVGGDPESVAGEYGRRPLYATLGYFSLVGLLRLHSLLGDYYQALKVLERIPQSGRSGAAALYPRVPECQAAVYYYVGFAYLMVSRYQDAVQAFASNLLHIERTRGAFHRSTYKYEMINKRNEQTHGLLAIAHALHPVRLDESVHAQLAERYGDKMLRMEKGDPQAFQEVFTFACPKFLSPVAPDYDGVHHGNAHREPVQKQLKMFAEEVQRQARLATLRSYLRLYTAMPVAKLAGFLDTTEAELRIQLLVFKHKMKRVAWSGGVSAPDGELRSASELDFYIDEDVIHIADTRVAHRYGDFFIRQIHKLEELNRKLKKMSVSGGGGGSVTAMAATAR